VLGRFVLGGKYFFTTPDLLKKDLTSRKAIITTSPT
jgi:hypothetical protein